MSADEEKKLDDFTRKVIYEVGLDKPSNEFMDRLMIKIQKEQSYIYTPLIKKRGWGVIASFLTVSIVLLIKFSQRDSVLKGYGISDKIELGEINLFEKFHFSDTTTIILMVALAFILIQIPLMKRMYFNQFK
ncbi:hypothetical protein MQE36_10915 [Zhouia spongiae]|uniref:Uncharacterized protein n=1 Tax=Zhouia spongiae TaxID=2202721 RepID=A0ABY3YIS9_9FLAO|nr:hypothetical protein [Zhouia spongiae]UNY97595.1 hypothetical protein MQE36_10915 [Zhouia spongiae]